MFAVYKVFSFSSLLLYSFTYVETVVTYSVTVFMPFYSTVVLTTTTAYTLVGGTYSTYSYTPLPPFTFS